MIICVSLKKNYQVTVEALSDAQQCSSVIKKWNQILYTKHTHTHTDISAILQNVLQINVFSQNENTNY